MYEMQLASVKSNKINLEPLFMLFFIGIYYRKGTIYEQGLSVYHF